VAAALWLSGCSNPSGPSGGGPPNGPGGSEPPNRGGPNVLVGAGDIANCNSPGDEATARLLDTINGTIFTAGDNAYSRGSSTEFRDCYGPTWGRHRDRTYPTPGNHDYDSNDGARGYFDFFGDRAGPRNLGYYTYDVGTWRVYALNSEFDRVPGLGQSQMDWLRGELANRPPPCSIAVWHKPLYTSGPNGENPHMRDIFKLLYDNGVDIVLNGHDHLYERFAPQDANGRVDQARGIRQFTVGTGGVDTYTNPRVAPNSEKIMSAWGVLMLTLNSNTYDWEFIPVDPPFRDSGSGTCH
jgi:Calcineurin-like phosphoesterase